jgi:RHS repeat-associated protein
VTYGFDTLNRMSSAKEGGTVQLATYAYDALSRRTSLTYRAGMSSTYGFTDAGDLTSLVLATGGTGTVPSYTLSYSAAHQLASEATTGAGYVWQPPAAATDTYGAVNTLNQYPARTPSGGPAKSFAYDGNGNMTSANIAGVVWALAYDPENRLITANSATGTAAAYAYDVLGRRTQKSGNGVVETYFVDDGNDEIAEYTGAGAVSVRYVPGPAINEPIASIAASGTRHFFQIDHHGSVVAMAANNGNESEGPYTYDPFGNGAPTTGTPYKYVGMRLDAETGFYYDRARYYIPALGRFPQPDPVGYKADLNLYPYAGNDPTDSVDPTGLMCADPCPPQALPTAEGLIGIARMVGTAIHDHPGETAQIVGNGISLIPNPLIKLIGGGLELLGGAVKASDGETVTTTTSESTGPNVSSSTRAQEIHGALPPRTQRSTTTAVTETKAPAS